MALYGATAGVCAISEIRAAINQAVLAIVPHGVIVEYLFQTLTLRKDHFIKAYTQGGQPNLSAEIVKSFPIPIPPLSEQHAIAAGLSDVDALLDGLDRLIAKTRDLKQAARQQLLTGMTRLPGFSGEWETKQFGDLLAYERPDPYIVKSTEYSNHGDIPVLTANKAFILGYTTEVFGVCADLPAIVFDDFTTDSKFAMAPFKVKSSAIKLLRPRHDRTRPEISVRADAADSLSG